MRHTAPSSRAPVQRPVSMTRRSDTGRSSLLSRLSAGEASNHSVAVGKLGICSDRTSAPKWRSSGAAPSPVERDLLGVDQPRAVRGRHDVALDGRRDAGQRVAPAAAQRDHPRRHRRHQLVDQALDPRQRIDAARRDHQVPQRGARDRLRLAAVLAAARRLPQRRQLLLDAVDLDGDRLAARELLDRGSIHAQGLRQWRPPAPISWSLASGPQLPAG